jgi:mRNA-degrading endonuclease YafQ of YafQ-DinJ toxin-antitoxin module
MKYRFRAARAFWKNFAKLPERQKEAARRTFLIFKADPFDPRLRAHKINSLSAHYKRTIYAVEIEGDLRVVFFIDGDVVYTVDIGNHAIYRV